MTIKIEPYTYNTTASNTENPIVYWGIYLDDMEISTTSTKEKAQDTKEWMESWLEELH